MIPNPPEPRHARRSTPTPPPPPPTGGGGGGGGGHTPLRFRDPPGEARPAGRSQSRLGAGAIVGGVAETAGVAPFWIPRGSDLGRREELACRSHPSEPRPQDEIEVATEGQTLRERRIQRLCREGFDAN